MELIVRIVSQGALEEREYPNKQTGTPEKFATMPFPVQPDLQSGCIEY